MASRASFSSRIRFGAFELDAASGELRKAGIPIKLRLQAVRVLLMLTEHAGQVVTREEIRERLWSADTFVDFERSINFCINQIRAALGDDAEMPRYVETLPRRGYRFIASVTAEVSREPARIVSIAPRGSEALPLVGVPGEANTANPATAGTQVVPLRPAQPLATGWSWTSKKRMGVVAAALILASLATGFATRRWLSHSTGPSLQDIRITKLTSSGAVTGVAISPDARYAAYAKLEGRGQSLWVRQIAAQSDVQILPPGTGFHGLTFSPDGNYIYFVRSDYNNVEFKYLYSVPTLGGPVKKLFTDVDSPVSFSPDGQRFVFEHCVEGRDDIELKIASTEGGDDHVLAIIHNATSLLYQPGPNWSPDGRNIAVPLLRVALGSGWRWALAVVEVSNGSVREIFSSPKDIGRAVWLQADSLLVPLYDAFTNRGQLWTVSFPGGKVRRFTNDLTSYGSELDDYGFPLDRSRDGNALVALAVTQSAKVWMAPAASPWEAKQLTNNELPIVSVAEAADGRLWSATEDGQLWITNPDGSQATPYGDYRDIDTIVGCGRFMILRREEAGARSLTRLDVDAKHSSDLVTGSIFGPFCSPDGKFVFYTNGQQPQKIWRVPIEGGTAVEIAQILGDQIATPPSVSPDGSLIAYVYTNFGPSLGPSLVVIPSTGGPPIKSTPLQAEDWMLSWSPDGTGIQYLMNRNGATNLWEQPLSGGKPKQVTKFTSGLIFDFSWSFDRKHLLLTRGEISSDAVLLSNLH